MMRFGGGSVDLPPSSVSLGRQWATNSIPYINTGGGLPSPFTIGTHTQPKQINFDGGPAPAPSQINFDGGPIFTGGDMPPGAPGGGAGIPPANTSGGPPVQMSGAPAMAQFHDPEDQGLPPNILGAEGVRTTGTGPYDDAYRQNLATYAGGQFVRPPGPGFLGGNTSGGVLSFDPTGGLFGNPTGGGSAPVLGMPTSLLSQALGGNPFAYTPPPPPPPPSPEGEWRVPLRWWREQYLDDGGPFGEGRRFVMNME